MPIRDVLVNANYLLVPCLEIPWYHLIMERIDLYFCPRIGRDQYKE